MKVRRSRSGTVTALAALAAVAVTGCGGSNSSSKPNDAALERGLLHSGELAGLTTTNASPVTGVANWVRQEQISPSQASSETVRLRRIGFVAGISEQLAGRSQNRYGLTSVEQFASATGATAEVASETAENGPWTTFSVPGVPGARGFEQSGDGGGGRNIAFRHGDYVYLIGTGWQNGNANSVAQTKLIAVAQQLYHHVAG